MKERKNPRKEENQVEKEQAPKVPFAQRYIKERPTFMQGLFEILYHLVVLVVCFAVSYYGALYLFGDAINLYSDQTFTDLNDHIVECYDTEVGIDIVSLSNKEKVSHYSISDVDYMLENGQQVSHVLTCTKENGYFKAIIKVELGSDFSPITASKNYASMAQYQQQYHRDFGILMALIAIGTYLMIKVLQYGVPEVMYFISKKMHPAESKETSKNTASSSEAPAPQI